MKLGSQTASVTNHLYSRMTIGAPEPEVGMGVTVLAWTDRYAGTIAEIIKNGKYIKVLEDQARRVDSNGMSECQEYEYSPVPEGHGRTFFFKKEKDGRWSEVHKNPETGRYRKLNGGCGLRIGVRAAYHDYSF